MFVREYHMALFYDVQNKFFYLSPFFIFKARKHFRKVPQLATKNLPSGFHD